MSTAGEYEDVSKILKNVIKTIDFFTDMVYNMNVYFLKWRMS